MPSSMKCFKTFFKHTWQPEQMIVVPSPASIWDYPYLDQLTSVMSLVYEAGPDPQREFLPTAKKRIPSTHIENPSRYETSKTIGLGFKVDETELGEVKIMATTPSSNIATSNSIEDSAVNVPCGNGGCKSSRKRREPRHESPWHRLKTIFLVSVIAALIVWIIVFTLLSQYQIL